MSKPFFYIPIYSIFVFFTGLFFTEKAYAQPMVCGDPSSVCSSSCYVCDLDGFSGTNDDSNGTGQLPPGYCTNILHHAEWVGFVAGSASLSIEISASNCVGGNQGGIEAGIYSGSNCSGFSLVSDCPSNIGNGTSQIINTTVPLVVGEIYWLVTDGNGVNNCDYSITVLSGSTVPPPPDPIPAIIGSTSVCQGDMETYSIAALPSGASDVAWTFDGSPAGTGLSTSISFPNTGTFDVCATATNECGGSSMLCVQVTVSSTAAPTFTQLGPYCQGDAPDPLPASSNEGISGTWSPAAISTASTGTTTYTFTPDPVAHPCASTATMDVTVNPSGVPTFAQLGPYCQNDAPDPLPASSNEGISGTWNPATISTSTTGTTTYTFTPDPVAHPCASTATMDVTVNPLETATFTQLGPYCQNDAPDPLPASSNEGISGTWSPATISTTTTGTTTYTFTPDPVAHPCASTVTMDVTVNPGETATFNPLGPYCQNSVPDPLPASSIEGIVGIWNPATINTATIGTSNYTFTPDPVAHPCANPVTIMVTVNTAVTPTFQSIGPLCQNSVPPPLPFNSLEGINGSWSPSVISTLTIGTTTYTFTPDPVAHPCASTTAMDITIDPDETPTFVQLGSYCENDIPDPLPNTSIEGILGTWNPAAISTAATGTTTYIFTPNSVLHPCASTATMDVTVNPEETATFNTFGPYCQNASADPLPGISNEGIIGVWSPSVISTATVGTSNYIFTPNATLHPCAENVTITITVNSTQAPTFLPIDPLCQNSTPPALPLVSNEGIDGTWNPVVINTATVGTATYTFTPDPVAHPCANPTTLDVTVLSSISVVETGFDCAPDLLTYDLDVFISGGSGTYVSVDGGGFTVVDQGGGNYTVQNIPSGSGTTVTVTDNAGCTLVYNTIPQDCDCPTINPPVNPQGNIFCFGESPTPISVDDPGTGFQINWYDAGGTFLSNNNPFTPASAGTYSATIEEVSSGCESMSVDVTLTENPEIFLTENGFDCSSDLMTFDLEITLSGGSGTFVTVDAGGLNVVDNGGNVYTIEGVPSGNSIAITVIDWAGCTAVFNTMVYDCDCPTIAPPTNPQGNIFCFGGTPTPISVDDPGTGFQINWYDGTGTFLSNDNPFTPAAAGAFTATVEEISSGCESTGVNVTLTENPEITIAQGGFDCSADLTTYDLEITVGGGSGTFTNVDAGGLNVVDMGGGNYTVEAIASGSGVTVTVTDDENCTATLNTVPQNCDCPTIAAPTGATDNIFCFGGTPTAISVDDPGAGFQINWYDDSGAFLSNDNPFTPTAAGTFTATVEEVSSGCESQSVNVVLTENPQITIAQGAFDCSADLTEYDLEITVSGGSGTFTNVDVGGLNVVNMGGGMYIVEGIPSGNGVTVTVTDDEGCSATLNTVPQSCDCPVIDPPTNPQGNIFCFGEMPTSISVDDPGAGFQINWYDGTGAFLSNDNPFTPAMAGTFTATIGEVGTNCESLPVTVALIENPEILLAENGFECAMDLTTYDLEITVSGGSGTFTIDAGGLNVVDMGGGNYTVEGIASGSGVTVTVTDDEGCSATFTTTPQNCDCATVTAPTNPQGATICFGDAPTAISVDDPGAGFEVNWFDVLTGGTSLGMGAVFTPPNVGVFYAEITDLATACVSDRVAVELDEANEISASTNTQICESDLENYDLKIEIASGNAPYQVTAGGLTVVENSLTNFTIEQVSGAAIVNVDILDDLGCAQTVSLQPTILPQPVAEAGADQSLDCMAGETVLSGSTDIPNPTVEWSPAANVIAGGNMLAPTVDAAGWYFLTVTNPASGCSATDSVEVVSPNAFTAGFASTPTGCAGEENGSIAVVDIVGGMEPFLFSIDDGANFSTENVFPNLAAGSYEMVVQDGNGCEFSETVSVSGATPITLQLGATADLALGDSYPINVQTNLSEGAIGSIFWTPTESLDCGDCLEPTATPMATTTYALTLTDTLGCSASASITLMVDTRTKVYAPNAFSPNGDGFNDEFTIFAGEGVEQIDRMQVFNRWGDLVFESYNFPPGDPTYGWNGMHKGEMMNPDVFVFYAEIKMMDGRVELLEGEVVLVR